MNEAAAQAEDFSVIVDPDFNIPTLIALLVSCEETFVAIFDPFDRSLECPRAMRDGWIFGIKCPFWPEPPANIGRNHPHLIVVKIKYVEHGSFDPMRALRGKVYGEGVGCEIVRCYHASTFQRERATTMKMYAFAKNVLSRGECFVGVAVTDRKSSRDIG